MLQQENQYIYSVSGLNAEVREMLEDNFPQIWLEGEISNFVCPSSGHWYFTLKDDKAQIRGAMFRNRNMRCKERPKNGDHVLIRANVSLYEGRGDYQLIVEHLENAGDGKLQREFEALKHKLEKAGLFAQEKKCELPEIPQTLGVITSPTGAALRDILSVLERRMPSLPVIIYPSQVQGDLATNELVQAIQTANQHRTCDVLILARGGGSLEDLWPFNEETVARAIDESDIPIVSGVGHEIDFTIADFVADERAPTPSAAAEFVSIDQNDIRNQLTNLSQQLYQLTISQLKQVSHTSNLLSHRLKAQHPQQRLIQQQLQCDSLEKSLMSALLVNISQTKQRFHQLQTQFEKQNPQLKFQQTQNRVDNLRQTLQLITEQKLQRLQTSFKSLTSTLHAISPLATLGRGYTMTSNDKGQIIDSVKKAKAGDKVRTKLTDGEFESVIDSIL